MRTALITGGAKGIGRAIACEIARDHDVALTWLTTPPDEVLNAVPRALAVQANLTQTGTAEAVIDAVIRRFGRLDVIVNNAGIVHPTPADATALGDTRAMMDLHLAAPAALLSAALPYLHRGACILNISSINAQLAPNGAGIYGASKAALNHWTRAMAKELGPQGIRVNAIAPGAVDDPAAPRDTSTTASFRQLTPLGALATPRDIASAARFLCTDAARAITGEVLTVSGGYGL